jgi:FkbM family methyltransferase
MEIGTNTTFSRIVSRAMLHLAKYVQYRVRMLLQPTTITLNGVEIEVDRGFSPAMKSVIYRERYESVEARCISFALEEHDVVLEVGAGIGYISALCAKIIGSESVFAYEANPELLPRIMRTYKRNDVNPSIINAALGSKADEILLHVGKDFVGSSVIKRENHETTISVPCLNVNRELSRVKPTFLIIDIEGGELDLVQAIDYFGVDKILIELHERIISKSATDRVRAHLTRSGFTVNPKYSQDEVLLLEKLV